MTDPRCPLSRQQRAHLIKTAMRHPWRGEQMVHRRHITDTTAITEPGRPTRIIVTFDTGYHASGWWANSDYARCLHISVSHVGEERLMQVPGTLRLERRRPTEAPTDTETWAWARAFFGDDTPKAWLEPPETSLTSPHRLVNVAHARLFYDEHLQPILPEGEVYTLKPFPGSPPKIVDGRLGADVR